jgi:hypothetical protein
MSGELYFVAMSEVRRQMGDALAGSGPDRMGAANRPARVTRVGPLVAVGRLAAAGIESPTVGSASRS